MLGHVEPACVVAEHVGGELSGEVQEILAAERFQCPLDAHAIPEDAVEHEVADLVFAERPGEDMLGRVAEGPTAVASGGILATGDLQIGDGADGASEGPLATAVFAALRAGDLLGGGVNGYNDGCGCFGAHACGRGEEAVFNLIYRDASPDFQEQFVCGSPEKGCGPRRILRCFTANGFAWFCPPTKLRKPWSGP
jgi:hypothetical protein